MKVDLNWKMKMETGLGMKRNNQLAASYIFAAIAFCGVLVTLGIAYASEKYNYIDGVEVHSTFKPSIQNMPDSTYRYIFDVKKGHKIKLTKINKL